MASFCPIFCSANSARVVRPRTEYTNSIVTFAFFDGPVHSVLFSANPAFDRELVPSIQREIAALKREKKPFTAAQKRLDKAVEVLKYLTDQCTAFEVPANRIFYVPSNGKYCYETSDMYLTAFECVKQRLTKDTIMFHDAGNAFTKDQQSIAERYCGTEVVFPPIVHHFLSPNDNSLHGFAKNTWRKWVDECDDPEDDVRVTLQLLKLLNETPRANVHGWFRRNFLFDTDRNDAASVNAALKVLINGNQNPRVEFHAECLETYYLANPTLRPAPDAGVMPRTTGGTMMKH